MIFLANASNARQRIQKLCKFTARHYANRIPVKPPQKIRDPLEAPNALASTIEHHSSSYTFIHRPPPTAPSPQSTVVAPISPLLRPQSVSSTASPIPPLVRKEPVTHRVLSEAEIDQIRQLRNANPTKHTAGSLARQFGCSSKFVGLVAPLTTQVKQKRLEQRDKEHNAFRDSWGERKRTVKEIRQKRRDFW